MPHRVRDTDRSAAKTGIGPAFDLRGPNDLLGLMRIERSGGGGPDFGQNLHGEQFGVDFGLEGACRSDRGSGAVIRFHGFVRAEGYVPGIRLRHAAITRTTPESF